MNIKSLLWIVGLLAFLIGIVLRASGVGTAAATAPIIGGAILVLIYLVADFKNVVSGLGKKSTLYGASQFIMVIVMLGIVAFVLAYSRDHSKRFDMTENKAFTLDESTKNVLKSLDQDVKLVLFYDQIEQQSWKMNISDLLDQYKHENDKISYEFIDPSQKPQLVMNYRGEFAPPLPNIFVETKSGREKTKGLTEEDITNTIISLTRKVKSTVYFLTGHGEKSLSDETTQAGAALFKQQLEKKSYVVKELKLERQTGVPGDCSVLIIAGPTTDLFDYEMSAIDRYIDLGGNVIVMFEPESSPNMSAWMGKYGLTVGDDIVCEAEFQPDLMSLLQGKNAGQISISVNATVQQYPTDLEITKGFKFSTVYPTCRSLQVKEDLPEGISVKPILETKGKLPQADFPGSWAETDLEGLKQNKAQYDEGKDIKGPVTIAALVEIDRAKYTPAKAADATIKTVTGESRPEKNFIAAFGDSDTITNRMMGYRGGDIPMNTINYMVGEKDLITIDSKPSEDTSLQLSKTQTTVMGAIVIIIMPLVVIAIGIGLALRRRRMT